MVKIHKPKCENNDISTIRTSPESHLHLKKHLHKNPLYFKIYADFEADNEKDTFLVFVIKQLMFINKTQYLMVIV